jgi:Acetyl-CoA carboxylase, carboxyltransferase component (subunits alpha and beta)
LKTIKSKINTKSEDFIKNKESYNLLMTEYRDRLNSVMNGVDEKARERHLKRGKLLVRDRIELLLDKNTPFLELSTMAACDQYENQFPSAGIVTGIGVVHGRECVIVANDATVKGGTYIKETIKSTFVLKK